MKQDENDARWDLLQARLREFQSCQAFSFFEDLGFSPILIKGVAAGRNYPSGVGRSSVDIDLCFASDEFERAKEAYARNPIENIAVDFHDELRHLDSLSWNDLFKFSEKISLEHGKIRVLCAEDHLRVMCTHWLTDGGERKSRLWDIYYAVENRSADFDWNRVFGNVEEKRRLWTIFTIGAAHKYLGLKIEGLPFVDRATNLPRWFCKSLESSWEKNVPIVDLFSVLSDRKQFWLQANKRFPPNPIHATIIMNGNLNSWIRVHYQIGNLLMRTVPKWRRILNSIVQRNGGL